MSKLADELAEAWVEWDRQPGAEATARRRIAKTGEFAEMCGVSSLDIHKGVIELIHEGYTSREAINLLERAYQ